jgi:hypothetical protein
MRLPARAGGLGPDAGGRSSGGATAPSSPHNHRGRLRPTSSTQCAPLPTGDHAPFRAQAAGSEIDHFSKLRAV